MTEQEKKEILELIEEHLAKQMPQREDTQSTLAKTRNKWFKDNDGSSYQSLMSKAINDTHGSYVIWESVRKITCKICGVSYVRQIKDRMI